MRTMAKKSRYRLAADFFRVAVDIATSEQPVTEDRLIVGEFFLDLGKQLLKTHRHTGE